MESTKVESEVSSLNELEESSQASANSCLVVTAPSENEAIALQASKILSRIEDAFDKGTESEGSAWFHSSGLLSQSKSPEDIIALIQDLVMYEDGPQTTENGKPEQNQITNLPPINDAAKLTLVSHSISAYAMGLPRSHAQRLANRLTTDISKWLSRIFRFLDSGLFFHHDPLEGLVRVTKLALYKKYPRYLEEGFTVLASSPPLIYCSITPLGLVQHLFKQLSLPLHCIRAIPHNTFFGSKHSMDISALERKLSEDSQSNSVTPLMILAEAGSVLTGHCDNIRRLQEICDKYNIWLHLRGNSLTVLALNISTKDVTTKIADSVTLTLGSWLGIPSLPIVTLYKLADINNSPLVSSLVTDSISRHLLTLPLWTALQALGQDGIVNRFKQCFLVVEELYTKMKKFHCIRLLSNQPGGDTGVYTINEISVNPLNSFDLLELVSSSVVFQFVPQDCDLQDLDRVPGYYDKLNSWLGQILQRDIHNVDIELCEIEQYGVAIRICPLESAECPPTSEDIDNIISCLEQQIDILLATVHHKESFVKLVSENDSLHLVEMPGWAGLGGVRYAPPTWIHVMTDQAKNELNKLNTQLVDTLRSTDAAFSLGEGADGLACVRFGMVTHDTDVAELLSLVLQVGQEVEASSKLLDTMSEVVKRGIEAAQTDLERENAEKLWQEGILRHVPVVGTFVNWWSPLSTKETGVRGRSLNLQAGVVESTENVYKYHTTKIISAPGTKTPPQPSAQGSQSHSRSSSHSSGKDLALVTNSVQTQITNSELKS